MNSLWLNENKFDNFECLSKDISCDVCVVGAGIFGLTCAYYLSKKGLKVVIVDKDNISQKTTGHTTAKITSGHGLFYTYLTDNYGNQFAKDYLSANEEAITNIKKIIDTEQINCEFEKQSSYVYSTSVSDIEKIKKEVSILNSIGFPAKFVSETGLPFKVLGAVKYNNQAEFNPIKYVYGLVNSILKYGGILYTNTTVFDIKKSNNEYIVFSKNNKINAKNVILATNYPFKNFPGMYFLKMYKSTSYVLGIDTNESLFDGMYITASEPIYSFRTANYNNKKILLLGGLGHKTGLSKKYKETFGDLEEYAKALYPDYKILFKWNTCDCITLDKIPYIGQYSSLMKNFYVGTGFNKWGMTSSNVAANIISDSILGKENKYSYIFGSTRFHPIKNFEETKNILSESINSLVVRKFKKSNLNLDSINYNSGGIIDFDNKKIGIYKDSSR